jgi:hypothetical protein
MGYQRCKPVYYFYPRNAGDLMRFFSQHHLNCIDTELKAEIGLLADQTEHLKVNHCTVREYKL